MGLLNLSPAAKARLAAATKPATTPYHPAAPRPVPVAAPTVRIAGRTAAPQANRLGAPAAKDEYHNCMTCQRWSACRDPARAFNYRCTRWQELVPLDTSFLEAGESTLDAVRRAPPVKRQMNLDVLLHRISEREQETDISKMLDEALESGFEVPPDLRIDDRDLHAPANYFEWVRSPEMSGMSGDLFPMQHKIMVEYHGEYCPRCSDNTFLDRMHVNTKIAHFEERIVLLRNGVCPCCNISKSELVHAGELPEFYTLNGVAGQRGGKTAVINVSEGYGLARWVKVPNPQRIFDVLDQQVLVATYCALTFNQVRANLWDPFVQFLTNSPWFKNYHGLLDFYGERLGEELYQFKDIHLRYRHRGLFLVPSGPNKRTMRGATRFSAVVDELGWFPFGDDKQDNTKMSAEEIHTALENSLATIQAKHEMLLKAGHSNLPKPLMSNISSPSELNDMIMTLHKASLGSSSAYTFKLPTWEMNPNLPKDCAFLKRKFEQNEQGAMRDFGCEPPMSSAAWITEIKNAEGVFDGNKNNIIVRQGRFTSRSGVSQTGADIDIRQRSNGGRVLALDAGYVNNSFSFAVGRLDEGLPVIEALGEVIPHARAPISFENMFEEVLLPIAQGCGIQIVVSDRWQNILMLQRLEAETGCLREELRVKYPDFEDFRERIYNQTITLPKLEMDSEDVLTAHDDYPSCFLRKPSAHLLYQMFTVRDYPGKTVEKGSGSTDDIFRSVTLALKAMNEPEIAALLNNDGGVRGPMVWGKVDSLKSGGRTMTGIGVAGARSKFGGSGGGAGHSGKAGVGSSRR